MVKYDYKIINEIYQSERKIYMEHFSNILNLYHIKAGAGKYNINAPKVIKDYYNMFSNYEFNRVYNYLISPDEMYVSNGFMIFYTENQDAVRWGYKITDTHLDDPPVYQTADGENFFVESDKASEFLISMSYFQGLLGGLDYCDEFEIDFFESQVKLLRRKTRLKSYCTNPFMGMELYESSSDNVIGVTPINGKYIIMFGAMTKNVFAETEKMLNEIIG